MQQIPPPAPDDLVSTCQWSHPQFQLQHFSGVTPSKRAVHFLNAADGHTYLSESEMGVLRLELEHQRTPLNGQPRHSADVLAQITTTLQALREANEYLPRYRASNPGAPALDKGRAPKLPPPTRPIKRPALA